MLYNPQHEKPLDEVSNLLLKAADLMEKGGHCKGILWRNGAMCFMGALYNAQGTPVEYSPAIQEAVKRTSEYLGLPCEARYWSSMGKLVIDSNSVVNWNNAPERTGEEVVEAMRMTAYQGAFNKKETVDAV